jgi:hypothetical protein
LPADLTHDNVLTVAEAWHSIPFLDFTARGGRPPSELETIQSRLLSYPWLACSVQEQGVGSAEWRHPDLSRRSLGFPRNLEFAHGTEWSKILAFTETALEWTEADESRLTAAFTQYQTSGVDDDISECSSPEDVTELRDVLEEMQTKFGVDFVRKVRQLDEDLY